MTHQSLENLLVINGSAAQLKATNKVGSMQHKQRDL